MQESKSQVIQVQQVWQLEERQTSNTNNAEFRYGGGSGAPYSSAQSLDIINYGTGNLIII